MLTRKQRLEDEAPRKTRAHVPSTQKMLNTSNTVLTTLTSLILGLNPSPA